MTIRDDNQCRLTSNISLEEAYSRIAQGQEGLSFLRRNDQLNVERAEGRTFHGFNEGMLCFRPTYKVCSSSYFFFFLVYWVQCPHTGASLSLLPSLAVCMCMCICMCMCMCICMCVSFPCTSFSCEQTTS